MSTFAYCSLMNKSTGKVVESLGVRYARFALGVSFLSAVADRFGLWGKLGTWGNFAIFEQYTAKLLFMLPQFSISFFAWAATIAEIVLGVALVLGIWPRWVAWSSALLLALFAMAMTLSLGIKRPLDYSVFSASACAVLLAIASCERTGASHQPIPEKS